MAVPDADNSCLFRSIRTRQGPLSLLDDPMRHQNKYWVALSDPVLIMMISVNRHCAGERCPHPKQATVSQESVSPGKLSGEWILGDKANGCLVQGEEADIYLE